MGGGIAHRWCTDSSIKRREERKIQLTGTTNASEAEI
jgi:hypothetical protein